jgi:hypothetical protein
MHGMRPTLLRLRPAWLSTLVYEKLTTRGLLHSVPSYVGEPKGCVGGDS